MATRTIDAGGVNTVDDGRGLTPTSRIEPLAEPMAPEPNLSELFRELGQESSTLVRQEIALAKAEIKESASNAIGGAVWMGIWGGVALVGGLVLTAFLVLLVGDLLNNYWLSALIVGVVFMAVGGGLAMSNLTKIKRGFAADKTMETLRRDKDWARTEARQMKRGLTS